MGPLNVGSNGLGFPTTDANKTVVIHLNQNSNHIFLHQMFVNLHIADILPSLKIALKTGIAT